MTDQRGGPVMAATPRSADDTEAAEIATVVAAAFHDDPVTVWLFPDPEQRRELLPRCFELDVRVGLAQGLVDTVDGFDGAAVWWRLPDVGIDEGFAAYVDQYVAVSEEAGPRVAAVFELLAEEAPAEPHYSLELIGTLPGRQGSGLGSLVLGPGLERCDEEGVAAHLWSSNPRNLSFYRRHGFTVVREARVPGGPPVWMMERRPRSG